MKDIFAHHSGRVQLLGRAIVYRGSAAVLWDRAKSTIFAESVRASHAVTFRHGITQTKWSSYLDLLPGSPIEPAGHVEIRSENQGSARSWFHWHNRALIRTLFFWRGIERISAVGVD
jgi:hypothetical protein